ncbi:hypothetical protein C8F04DRAFT_1172877 [Mycena alexandri]|uniref:Uncharacterized protein n=1 Tax=Mycena alexandri TaxID=1745969 RepID=A0AAD6XCA0_9AGAR|nr:hypothetical protein C8F04DRAFT_1172877 [Mycena alexandri]
MGYGITGKPTGIRTGGKSTRRRSLNSTIHLAQTSPKPPTMPHAFRNDTSCLKYAAHPIIKSQTRCPLLTTAFLERLPFTFPGGPAPNVVARAACKIGVFRALGTVDTKNDRRAIAGTKLSNPRQAPRLIPVYDRRFSHFPFVLVMRGLWIMDYDDGKLDSSGTPQSHHNPNNLRAVKIEGIMERIMEGLWSFKIP